MILIHAMNDFTKNLPRLATINLKSQLQVMPVAVVTGARQTGKSTLSKHLISQERRFLTLDDLDILDAARRDPESLLESNLPLTIDEAQLAPDLLRSIKRFVDNKRRAGQFLLTGSANFALMRRVSESLAGRASYLTLWPMTCGERLGLGRAGLWSELLSTPDKEWLTLLRARSVTPQDWRSLASCGGFPFPALHLQSGQDRAIWFDGYVRTYLERDLQNLSSIAGLPDFRRLMRAVCLRLGRVSNQTEFGRITGLAQPTVHRYLNLLEASYMLVRLPAYTVNRGKRLVKSVKLYWCDSGLALHISQEEPQGFHFENMILNDLLSWRDSLLVRPDIFYWRTVGGCEVDFVVETPDFLLPIEVKASKRPRLADIVHLQAFRAEYGPRVRSGLLLHTGDMLDWIAPGILAVPWWRVL